MLLTKALSDVARSAVEKETEVTFVWLLVIFQLEELEFSFVHNSGAKAGEPSVKEEARMERIQSHNGFFPLSTKVIVTFIYDLTTFFTRQHLYLFICLL